MIHFYLKIHKTRVQIAQFESSCTLCVCVCFFALVIPPSHPERLCRSRVVFLAVSVSRLGLPLRPCVDQNKLPRGFCVCEMLRFQILFDLTLGVTAGRFASLVLSLVGVLADAG